MIKFVVVFALIVVVAQAKLCPDDYCDKVQCEKLTDCHESNGQKIRVKGSFCQCCDTCVNILREGEDCLPDIPNMIITAECAEGLQCDETTLTCRVE